MTSPIIIIRGPTAVGKSYLATALAISMKGNCILCEEATTFNNKILASFIKRAKPGFPVIFTTTSQRWMPNTNKEITTINMYIV